MPSDVVSYINTLAAAEKQLVEADPIFRVGTRTVMELADDVPEVVLPEGPNRVHVPIDHDPIPRDAVENLVDVHDDEENIEVGELRGVDTVQEKLQVGGDTQSQTHQNLEIVEEETPFAEPPQELEPLRRSSRLANRTNQVAGHHLYPPSEFMVNVVDIEYGFNISVKRALEEMRDAAMESMVAEMKQHVLDKKTFHPVFSSEKPEGTRAIRSHMFLKEKRDANGVFQKVKARLVAGGNAQDKTLYDDIASPTASIPAVFTIAAIAAHERRFVTTVDIAGAYLNVAMEKDVYMILDQLMASIDV